MKNISYEEWSKVAESEYNCEFGHDWNRDVYSLPNKTIVYHEIYIPRHWGKTPREQTVVEICVNDNKENNDLAKRYGGRLWQTPYGKEGLMMFVFDEKKEEPDSLKTAYNFAMKERDNIMTAEYVSCI